jgi:hypothetical protein
MQYANNKDAAQISREIGARIAKRMAELKLSDADIAARSAIGHESIRNYRYGRDMKQLTRVLDLTRALEWTPNDLFRVGEGGGGTAQLSEGEKEAAKGLLEAMFIALRGMALEEARPLAETVLKLLDDPALRSSGISPKDTARILGMHVISQFMPPKRV